MYDLFFNLALSTDISPSLDTQSYIKGLLVVQDFCFWAVWAAGPVLKKSWGPIMSNFGGRFFHVLGGKKRFKNFLKTP